MGPHSTRGRGIRLGPGNPPAALLTVGEPGVRANQGRRAGRGKIVSVGDLARRFRGAGVGRALDPRPRERRRRDGPARVLPRRGGRPSPCRRRRRLDADARRQPRFPAHRVDIAWRLGTGSFVFGPFSGRPISEFGRPIFGSARSGLRVPHGVVGEPYPDRFGIASHRSPWGPTRPPPSLPPTHARQGWIRRSCGLNPFGGVAVDISMWARGLGLGWTRRQDNYVPLVGDALCFLRPEAV